MKPGHKFILHTESELVLTSKQHFDHLPFWIFVESLGFLIPEIDWMFTSRKVDQGREQKSVLRSFTQANRVNTCPWNRKLFHVKEPTSVIHPQTTSAGSSSVNNVKGQFSESNSQLCV